MCEAHDPKISAAKVFVFAKQMLDAAEQVRTIRLVCTNADSGVVQPHFNPK